LSATKTVSVAAGEVIVTDLAGVFSARSIDMAMLPYVARLLIENLIRQQRCGEVDGAMPDSSGVPVLADLAALRDAVAADGGAVESVRLAVPAHLVVDHSLQVDRAGSPDAMSVNMAREFERNGERYRFLRWAHQAFDRIRIVPPGAGIIHQINLERLASVVAPDERFAPPVWAPELVVGTDSHTPMINGAGVLGWGVGGIEAETVFLGQPLVLPKPRVVGVELTGRLGAGVLAADLALAVTATLRSAGVVGAFVEFFGEGVVTLSVPDRATVANMAPEYGATVGYFPVDAETLAFLRNTDRDPVHVAAVEAIARALGIFREAADTTPCYDARVTIDLAAVEPMIAGPKRPEDRVAFGAMPREFADAIARAPGRRGFGIAAAERTRAVGCTVGGREVELRHGSVVIAAITSCTNTANPAAMISAGLTARAAVARGLRPAAWVKTSFAPGSRAVPEYLSRMGLMEPLEALGFGMVGFGCTTCGGKSGPLDPQIAGAIEDADLVAVAVLSGNRNFEGRIHRLVRAAYLAPPHVVVGFAIAGRIDINLQTEQLGRDKDGRPVFFRDIAPDPAEVARLAGTAMQPQIYAGVYRALFEGPAEWQNLDAPTGLRFPWDPRSTYLVRPPFFDRKDAPLGDGISGARVLCLLGDAVNTDHISPGGEIPPDSAAGFYLRGLGIEPPRFNTYVGRRGNPEVMRRATFAHVRFRNLLTPEREGGYTRLMPEGDIVAVHEAADAYAVRGVPLIVVAAENYGTGSSRDWAAKGPMLLGVRAILATSFERIHRSNLIGMGILPLCISSAGGWRSLGLDGRETYDIDGLNAALANGAPVRVTARGDEGRVVSFHARADLATPSEVRQIRHGGIFRLARESPERHGR
jgi:aconitate hydratase